MVMATSQVGLHLRLVQAIAAAVGLLQPLVMVASKQGHHQRLVQAIAAAAELLQPMVMVASNHHWLVQAITVVVGLLKCRVGA